MTQKSRKDAREIRGLAIARCREAAAMEKAGKYRDALNLLTEAAPVFESVKDALLLGRFNTCLGKALEHTDDSSNHEEYLRRALEAYTVAYTHFKSAGARRSVACAEKNLGRLYLKLKDYRRAHFHLHRAQRIFIDLSDHYLIAQVKELRARVLLALGKNVSAARLVNESANILEQMGDHIDDLTRALITRGRALARTGKNEWAIAALRRAHETSLAVGNRECAGDASLALIEELNVSMTAGELVECFLDANDLLRSSNDLTILTRLSFCARIVAERSKTEIESLEPSAAGIITFDKPISLSKEVNKYEGKLVKRAMELCDYKVQRAARLLGLNSHQTLLAMLNGRHRDLVPPDKRRTRTASA